MTDEFEVSDDVLVGFDLLDWQAYGFRNSFESFPN